MLTNAPSSIFTNANSVQMFPIASAEWNYNLFVPPYVTVAGDGTPFTPTLSSGSVSASPVSKENFTTKTFSAPATISYTFSASAYHSYKVVTYVKVSGDYPAIINTWIKDSNGQYGSKAVEVNSFSWTKIETLIGGSTVIASPAYSMSASAHLPSLLLV